MPGLSGVGTNGEGPGPVWKPHWKLTRDPFLDEDSPFVPLAAHQEAVARLAETIETGRRRAVVCAPAGVGKSRILAQAVAETRAPGRRVARAVAPSDGASLFAALAAGLGVRAASAGGRGQAWRSLADGVRVCRLQRLHVVLAVDDCQHLAAGDDRRDLDRLNHVDAHPAARVTVLQVFRSGTENVDEDANAPWELAIRVPALTRSECDAYVAARLAAAGRSEPAFTPRAIDRLHVHARGVPQAVNGLATLALMAGAVRGLEMVTPDVVEGAAVEGSWARATG